MSFPIHGVARIGQCEVEVIEVVRTTLTRRGEGRTADDPVRRVTQYWSTDGELLAERDEWAESERETA